MKLISSPIKYFIYLAIFITIFSFSSFAKGNMEISGHFGMKFGSTLNLDEIVTEAQDWDIDQKNRAFHFGEDLIYRIMMENGSLGIGVRYRFAFTGERDFEGNGSGQRGESDENDKYQFSHHRVALLANYRFHFDHFFVGPVLGLDIWKYLKYTDMNEDNGTTTYELTSNQLLWNQISGQLGLELGYKITHNLLVKLEVGYDLSGFSDLKCKINGAECDGDVLENRSTDEEDANKSKTLKLNGFYAALGVGLFFGQAHTSHDDD